MRWKLDYDWKSGGAGAKAWREIPITFFALAAACLLTAAAAAALCAPRGGAQAPCFELSIHVYMYYM